MLAIESKHFDLEIKIKEREKIKQESFNQCMQRLCSDGYTFPRI